MADEIIDVNNEVDPSTTDPAGEEITPEQNVPYSRFKEVNDTVKSLKEEINQLKTRVPEPEEKEPQTWKEVAELAAIKAEQRVKETLSRQQEKESLQEQKIEQNFKVLESLGHKVTPEIRKTILEEMIKTGNDNVIEIYTQKQAQFKSGQLKREGFVPPTRAGSGTDKTPAWSYKDIRSKSFEDIVAEASQ